MILANAGLPMLGLAWPWAFFLLVPIIAIETWASRRFPGTFAERLRSVGVANIISTLAGWPIAWWIMVFFQMNIFPNGGGAYGISTPLGVIASITLQAAWLIPYEDALYWMIPSACAFLMIPFLFISVLIEDTMHRFGLPELAPKERRKLTWISNLWSYGFLISLFLLWLVWTLATHVPKQ